MLNTDAAADAAEEMVLDDVDGDKPHKSRRKRTPYDYALAAGSLAGAFLAVSLVASAAADKSPFASKAAVGALDVRVAKVESSLDGIQYNQLQSLKLQLTDKVEKIGDDIGRTPPMSPEMREKRHDQNEIQLQLDTVQAQIRGMQRRGVPGNGGP